MSNDLVLRVAQENNFTQTQVELIRNIAAQGCSDEEVAQLLIMAGRTGLDPLARQIYMIPRYDKRRKRNVATPQTGIDGYRLIADRTERYAPGREPTYEYDDQGNLVSATAYVRKLVGGTWHEVAATAFWDEYKPSDGGFMWGKMPRTMLAKCAEALAIRRAFPADLAGLYTDEEMAQAGGPHSVTTERPAPELDIIEAEVVPPACADCDSDIQPAGRLSAEQVAEYGRSEFGRAVCVACGKKAREARDGAAVHEAAPEEHLTEAAVIERALQLGYYNHAKHIRNAARKLAVSLKMDPAGALKKLTEYAEKRQAEKGGNHIGHAPELDEVEPHPVGEAA